VASPALSRLWYQGALAAVRQASEHRHVWVSVWVLPELIERAPESAPI
jgi:hypothetical protein